MKTESFFALHRDLPREGPGKAADVLWALEAAGVPAGADIADFACGPGADTVTLAKARPEARVFALDKTPHFVAAARERVAGFGSRVRVVEADMTRPDVGPFDFIWCAGALYFLGIEAALTAWRSLLRPGGHIAFSEPVWVSDPPSAAARAFWADYPGVGSAADIGARVCAVGYETRATRLVTGKAWEDYYSPQIARIARLRSEGVGADVEEVLRAAEREIALWRAAPDEIAYLLSAVRPE